jgi:hypothetical protein
LSTFDENSTEISRKIQKFREGNGKLLFSE